MDWTSAVDAGAWLAARIDEEWRGTIHDVVPRGFDAYARVFHTVLRDRPVGRPWPPLPQMAHRRTWIALSQDAPEIDAEKVTWADTAAAFGTAMHPLVQWRTIVAPGVVVENEDGPRDRDGWRYGEPRLGQMGAEQLATVARVLSEHTTTREDGHVGVWEGWGGLLGHEGPMPSRAFLQATDGAADIRHRRLLSTLVPERFRSPWARDRWQPGILSDEISRGPRLQLPHRGHVLFTGGVAELTSPDWVRHAPWRDREAERRGLPPDAESPSLVWPADRAWVLVSEVDWDSSVVAGSVELVAALVAAPEIEALPIPAGASLAEDPAHP